MLTGVPRGVEPKSVPSAVLGVVSPSTMFCPLPLTAISEPMSTSVSE